MAQVINKKLLKHLAELARIDLGAKETTKFIKDLTRILKHFEELQKVDTEGIEPMIGGTNLKNILRRDDVDLEKRVESVSDAGHIIKAFPEGEGGYLKIPPVF